MEQDVNLEAKAKEALLRHQQKEREEREKRRHETAEQRDARRQGELENRDRVKELERKQRRLEATAARVGLSVEELEAQQETLGYGAGGDLAIEEQQQDVSVVADKRASRLNPHAPQAHMDGLYDEALFHTGSAKDRLFDRSRLEKEMERQDKMSSAPSSAKDIFGVQSLLKKRSSRDE